MKHGADLDVDKMKEASRVAVIEDNDECVAILRKRINSLIAAQATQKTGTLSLAGEEACVI